MALCANWVESVFDLKVTGICFFTKVDILVELLWCWICFNYFVHKFRVRLILHGITSHALNPFGWGWGGVKNVCDNHFEFVVFLGLFWWMHSDITRYIHVYTYTHTYIHIHIHINIHTCFEMLPFEKNTWNIITFVFSPRSISFSVFTIIMNYI